MLDEQIQRIQEKDVTYPRKGREADPHFMGLSMYEIWGDWKRSIYFKLKKQQHKNQCLFRMRKTQ